MAIFAAIRIRGHTKLKREIEDTMRMLRLTRANHCVVLSDSPQVRGMLQKVKDYITWGELKKETLAKLVQARGRTDGNKMLTIEQIKKITAHETIEQFLDAIWNGELKYSELKGVKPVFRLSPPKKGYEGIKRHFTVGGALGYRGEAINELIERMI